MTRGARTLSSMASTLTLAACGVLSAGEACGQAAADRPAMLEELVVTAERREQNLQVVAAAATALTGADLDKKGVTSVDGLQFSTPSLTISNSGQGNQFNIRGIGRQQNGLQFPSGVVTYRDGVASFPGYFQSEPYFDIANIAVFRGPQGTFAGQNANGGAVFITTRSPSLDGEVSGDVQLQAGNYDSFGVRGAVNLPVNETLALRLALNAERRDSFFDFTGPTIGDDDPGHLRTLNVRVGLLWKPGDAFQVLWKTDFNEVDTGGYPVSPVPGNTIAGRPFGTLFKVGSNAPHDGHELYLRSVLQLDYTFGGGVILRSISGAQYGEARAAYDFDGTDTLRSTFSTYAVERIYSQEINLLSPDDGRLRWVLGAYYQRDNSHLPREDGFLIHIDRAVPLDFQGEFNLRLRDKAVFGQVSYDLSPTLEVQAGLRYNEHTTKQDNFQRIRLPLFGLDIPSTIIARQQDDKVTGKLALNWKASPDHFLYAFVATGHKSGGANTDPGTPIFKPEDVTDYEVGWKATLLDGRLRTQLGAFYNRYRNYQFRQRDPTANNGAGATFGLNIPGITVIYGAEAQAQAVFGALSIDGSIGYVHSELPHHLAVDPRFPNSGPQDIGGRRAPYSPKWTASLGVEYAFDLPNGATLTPRVDVAHTGSQYTTVYQVPQYDILYRRTLVNAQVAYEQGPWRAAVFATNLTDEHYIAAIQFNDLRFAGPPRQVGVRLARRF